MQHLLLNNLFCFLLFALPLSVEAVETPSQSLYARNCGIQKNDEILPLKEGWFVGTQVGTQFYFSKFKFRKSASIGYGFTPVANAYVGKWVSNFVAVRASFDYNNVTGGVVSYVEAEKSEKVTRESFSLFHISSDLIFDVRYLLKGEKTRYAVCPMMSLGFVKNTSRHTHGPSFALGAMQTWKINDELHFQLETKYRMMADEVNARDDHFDSQLQISVGLMFAL